MAAIISQLVVNLYLISLRGVKYCTQDIKSDCKSLFLFVTDSRLRQDLKKNNNKTKGSQ